jgi:hypothetical protein
LHSLFQTGRRVSIALGFVLGLAAALSAQAATLWDWSYTAPGIAASGTLTTADTANSQGFYPITSITGTRNGETITGLQRLGTAIPGNEGYLGGAPSESRRRVSVALVRVRRRGARWRRRGGAIDADLNVQRGEARRAQLAPADVREHPAKKNASACQGRRPGLSARSSGSGNPARSRACDSQSPCGVAYAGPLHGAASCISRSGGSPVSTMSGTNASHLLIGGLRA